MVTALRRVDAPFVAAAPAGARVRTRLRVSARDAQDGTVEALERPDKRFVLAVQWHPEKTLNDRYSKKLFAAFINASRKS